jgi:predicted homoserine dehydrogenase-like protein
VLVETAGSVEFGAQVCLEAFKHGKDVVLLNAEIDATIGPILQVYTAKKYGVVLSACDGDERRQINRLPAGCAALDSSRE